MTQKLFLVKDWTVSFLLADGSYSKPLEFELFIRNDIWDDEWLSMEIHEYFDEDELAKTDNYWNGLVIPLYNILKKHKAERKAAGW